MVSSNSAVLLLTEENLKKLQPSLIQPMPPVSIHSSTDDDAAAGTEAEEQKIIRLKSWVYNVMQTLNSLGKEGRDIVAADELYIAGPCDLRLKEPSCDSTGSRIPQSRLKDVAFWEAKFKHLQDKCRPLAQARRKRRRLEPEAAAAEEAQQAREEAEADKAARMAANPNLTPEDLEEAQLESRRIQESQLLWTHKFNAVKEWVKNLETTTKPRSLDILDMGSTPGEVSPSSPPDSSIVEITPAQFTQAAVHEKPRHPSASATIAAATMATDKTKDYMSAPQRPHQTHPSRDTPSQTPMLQSSIGATGMSSPIAGDAMVSGSDPLSAEPVTPNTSTEPARHRIDKVATVKIPEQLLLGHDQANPLTTVLGKRPRTDDELGESYP